MNTIPLHQLPDKAFESVLRSMENYDQLAYSLCSRNAKKSIKSLKLKAKEINFKMFAYIVTEIHFENFIQFSSYIRDDEFFPNDQSIAHRDIKVYVRSPFGEQVQWSWNFKNFEYKEWVHHFCEVLHYPRIDKLVFSGESIDDNYIEPVQKVIKGLQIGRLALCGDLTNDFLKKALESFPDYEKLSLDQIPFDSHKLNKYLVQNLKSLCIEEAQRLKIDQVFVTNSETIRLYSSEFTENDFNRFLKLWIRGSNSRLKFFYRSGDLQLGIVSLNKNVILKGIKYERIPLDSQEVYKDYTSVHFRNVPLAGGFRIWRPNGTSAVIVVEDNKLKFIVE
ncbi:unnamed protein product [Caenorhabditis brenneri]